MAIFNWMQFGLIQTLVVIYQTLDIDDSFHAGDIYIFKEVGDSIELSCSVNNSMSRSFAYIVHCSSPEVCRELNVTNRNTSMCTSELEMLQPEDSGSYYCNLGGNLTSRIHLKVGNKPKPLVNVSCLSLERRIHCSWNKDEINLRSQVPSIWRVAYRYQEEINNCSMQETPRTIECTWDVQSPFSIYEVNVVESNKLGSATSAWEVIPYKIMKPKPVSSLRVTHVRGTSLGFKWTLSEDMYVFLGASSMQYILRYRDQYGYSQQIEFQSDSMVVNYTIKSLQSFTYYNVAVRCKPELSVGNTFWSEPSSVKTRTASTVPSDCPKTMVGLYYIDENKILLYVKEVPRKAMNAESAKYEVLLIHSDTMNPLSTTHAPSSTIQIPTSGMMLPALNSIKMLLYTTNIEGRSLRYSTIYVTDKKLFTGYVWTEYNMNSHEIRLHYTETTSTDRGIINTAIFFWCARQFQTEHVCKSDVDWKLEHSLVTSVTIQLAGDQSLWLFGIAFQYSSDDISDGIHFSECNFKSTTAVVDHPRIFIETTSKNDFDVIIWFGFDVCKDLPSRPISYQVYYRKNIDIRNTICGQGSEWRSLSTDADLSRKNIHIPNLNPYFEYDVCMQIETKGGKGTTSDVITTQIIRADADVPVNLIIGIVLTCVVIILLGFVVWRLIKCWKTSFKKVDIDIPDVFKVLKMSSGKSSLDVSQSYSSTRSNTIPEKESFLNRDSEQRYPPEKYCIHKFAAHSPDKESGSEYPVSSQGSVYQNDDNIFSDRSIIETYTKSTLQASNCVTSDCQPTNVSNNELFFRENTSNPVKHKVIMPDGYVSENQIVSITLPQNICNDICKGYHNNVLPKSKDYHEHDASDARKHTKGYHNYVLPKSKEYHEHDASDARKHTKVQMAVETVYVSLSQKKGNENSKFSYWDDSLIQHSHLIPDTAYTRRTIDSKHVPTNDNLGYVMHDQLIELHFAQNDHLPI